MSHSKHVKNNENTIILIMLYCIAFVGVFAVDFYLPAIPRIAVEFKLDPGTIGLTMSSYTFTFALGHLIVGSASDHWGRKRTFEIGLLISIVGTFFCMVSNNFWELFIARGIQGFGLSCFVLTNAIIRDVFSNEIAIRIRISRNLVAYFLIAVAPSIGVIVLNFSNWRMIFAIFLFFSALVFIYIKFFGVETNKNLNHDFNLVATLKQFSLIVKHRTFLKFSSISTLAFSVHYCFVTISSNLLLNKMNLTSNIYGKCMFGYGVSFLIGAILAMYLVKKLNMSRLLEIGAITLIIGGIILLIIFLMGKISLVYLSIAVIVCVIGISFITPSAVTFAMTEFENQAGSASACLGVMQFSVAALFSAVVNIAFGYSIILIGLLAIITGLLAYFPAFDTFQRPEPLRAG